jgi:hypothetical protein
LAGFACLIASFFGCDRLTHESEAIIVQTARTSYVETKRKREVLDAGIVFNHLPNYVCIPFQNLKITDGDEVVALSSTCHCVRPSIVMYGSVKEGNLLALKLDFVNDKQDDPGSDSARLSVVVQLTYSNGTESQIVVDLRSSTSMKTIVGSATQP